jgi:hypothetical protein
VCTLSEVKKTEKEILIFLLQPSRKSFVFSLKLIFDKKVWAGQRAISISRYFINYLMNANFKNSKTFSTMNQWSSHAH